MMDKKVYLKPNVLAEPLVNQWYAWPSLIPPATAAMYLANSHLKIMQSFISAPQIHVAALKNPAMRGGPFINCDETKVPEIKALMERTVREQPELLELAAALEALNNVLVTEAHGGSLEPLYERVPETLRGYVELVYDLNNYPSFRLIEGLLYKSRFYKESSQSIAFALCEADERPFVLSTPSLEHEGRLHRRMPFRSASLDELFKMKSQPQSLGYAREILEVGGSEFELCDSFFTQQEQRRTERYAGDSVRVRFFGHACILIETRDTSILIDPLVSYEIPEGISRYSYHDLPDTLDYVLITHDHQDHCFFETLLQLRHKVRHLIVPKNNGGGLADPSLKLILQNIGFSQVEEIDELETVTVAGGTITGLPFFGEHADLNIRSKLGHLIVLNGKSVLCAADSNNLEPKLYEHVHDWIGDIDVVFLGMECDGGPLSWLYGPLMPKPLARKFDQSRRLNGSDYARGIEIIKCLNPKQVYVYAMGQEPWLTFLTSIHYTDHSRPIVEANRLVEDCRRLHINSERLYGQKEIDL
jgi:L-ascorbate metabolism protein UlaG (beta-lactamase superfamily)